MAFVLKWGPGAYDNSIYITVVLISTTVYVQNGTRCCIVSFIDVRIGIICIGLLQYKENKIM